MNFTTTTINNLNSIQSSFEQQSLSRKRKHEDKKSPESKKQKILDSLSHEIDGLKNLILANPSQSTYSSFKLIRYIAAQQWETLIPITYKYLGIAPNSQPPSSCILTCYVVSSIFLGKTMANQMINRLKSTFSFHWVISLSSGNKLTYKIKNLFTGVYLYGHTNDNQEFYCPYINDFFAFNVPFIKKMNKKILNGKSEKKTVEKFEKKIECLNYNFNENIIDLLKTDLHSNSYLVSKDHSFLYCIGIVANNHVNKKKTSYDHAFLLELYRSYSGQPRIRLIQSWIHQAKLEEEFQKRNYEDNDEGTWNIQEFDSFIKTLKELYVPNKNRSNKSYSKCFGYDKKIGSLISLDEGNNKKILSGLSLRYTSFPFSPADCLIHISDIIQANHLECT
jgi:hypothetical protein